MRCGGPGAGEEGAALAPGNDEGGGGEEAPGEEPDQVQGPVEVAGELVVVAGDAAAEEAEDVLVDEVEPEEAVAVGAAGVAQAGEDVPGGGYGEEEEEAGEGLEGAPAVELAGPEEEEEDGGEDEDDGDEALGEDGEGQGGPHQVGPDGGVFEYGVSPLRCASVEMTVVARAGFDGAEEGVEGEG